MEQFSEKSYVLRDEAHPRLVLWWFPLSDTVWEFAARTGRICRFSSNTCSYLKLLYLSSVALCGAPFRIFPLPEHTWIFISDCRFV